MQGLPPLLLLEFEVQGRGGAGRGPAGTQFPMLLEDQAGIPGPHLAPPLAGPAEDIASKPLGLAAEQSTPHHAAPPGQQLHSCEAAWALRPSSMVRCLPPDQPYSGMIMSFSAWQVPFRPPPQAVPHAPSGGPVRPRPVTALSSRSPIRLRAFP